jgi:uncharacterized protein
VNDLVAVSLKAGLLCLSLALYAGAVSANPQTDQMRLMQALHAGDAIKLQRVLKDGANPNQPLPDSSLPLAWAADSQDLTLVEALLKGGAKPDASTSTVNFSPLVSACLRGDPAIVAALLDAGADVNRTTATGISPLALCAGNSSAAIVKRLLALGAQVDAVDETGQSPLMWAAAKGQVESLVVLVNAGAEVNRVTKKGFTPLFFALTSSTADAPLVLINAGGDTHYRTPDGTSAVQMAMYRKQYALAALLIEHGVELAEYDRNGNQLLHAAVLAKQPQLVSLLLAKGANPNALTGTSKVVWRYEVNFTAAPYIRYPKSPLFLAVERGAPEIMKILVAAGADTKFRIDDGTNLVLAAAVTDPATLEQAFLFASDINVTNKLGQTPLLSLMNGASYLPITNPQLHELFKVLSKHGARIDIADANGQTPAGLAQTEEFRAKAEFTDVFL